MIERFETSGRPRAMGEAFGEQFREGVRELAESRMDHLAAFVRQYDPRRRLSRADLLEAARATVEAHGGYDAAIWEEFSAIARAARLGVEELLLANGLTDFRDFVLVRGGWEARVPAGRAGECSAFLVSGERAAKGQPIVGQTWDMNNDAGRFLVIVHRKPQGAPETLGLTTVGCLCLMGMNSSGVSAGNTKLAAADARAGVNYLFTITAALRCDSAAEAAAVVEAAPRLGGHDFYLADEHAAINVEATATRHHRTELAGEEVFVHTNHYLAEDLRPLELAAIDMASSRWRQERLAENFAGLSGEVTMEDGWRALSDNTRGAGAICNEDFAGEFSPYATVATMVQCPARRELHVCAGGGRTGEKQVLTL